ncbi:hypothetical protein MESS4_330187 [Mesorhizobium sp. STM 4661]|nr:hypothetical protein MESS4_330187 [Mesorhizobium sp. STM 4661]
MERPRFCKLRFCFISTMNGRLCRFMILPWLLAMHRKPLLTKPELSRHFPFRRAEHYRMRPVGSKGDFKPTVFRRLVQTRHWLAGARAMNSFSRPAGSFRRVFGDDGLTRFPLPLCPGTALVGAKHCLTAKLSRLSRGLESSHFSKTVGKCTAAGPFYAQLSIVLRVDEVAGYTAAGAHGRESGRKFAFDVCPRSPCSSTRHLRSELLA